MKYKTQIAHTHISNDSHDQLLSYVVHHFGKLGKLKSINDILLLMMCMAAPMLPILTAVLLVAFNRPICQTAQITVRN